MTNAKKVDKVMNYEWPETGAIFALGPLQSTLEESNIYDHAYSLLCRTSPRSAALIKANSHPDFFLLKPQEENHPIKIDQVRELIEWSHAKPQIAKRKIALIYPAEALNLQAANALLKTLEEVSEDTLFILVAVSSVLTLPATVLSRCYMIRSQTELSDPAVAGISDPLKDQVIKGLTALDRNQMDPVALAALWLKQDARLILYWLYVVLHQKICSHITNGRGKGMGLTLKSPALFHFLDQVVLARRSLHEHGQLNIQLMLEALLIQYCKVK